MARVGHVIGNGDAAITSYKPTKGFKITCKISIYKETFESKSVTVREGQQTVSKMILDKIYNEKKI